MIYNNIRLAWASIKTARLRSLFTMLGIIIGVASVVTTVSLGEGVRQQVKGQVDTFGKNLITVWPGNSVNRDNQGTITSYNFLSSFTTSTLSQDDVTAVENTDGVVTAAPLSVISGVASYEGAKADNAVIIATTSNFPELVHQKLSIGGFLSANDEGRSFAVIGSSVATALFKNNAPIGRSLTINDQQFLIKGVFEEFGASTVAPGVDFNNTIFIPYTTGQTLAKDRATVFQIFAQAENADNVDQTKSAIEQNLGKLRGGQTDFTVLKQEETLVLTNNVIALLTGLIAAIAAVSLIVGGVGIMNVMLVSVTERTHEIGVRKAVGATDRQILLQFLVEAVTLTVVGSVIGILVALVANGVLRATTDLKPVISPYVIAVSIGVALLIGVMFGVIPALKAAKKDPIAALRNE